MARFRQKIELNFSYNLQGHLWEPLQGQLWRGWRVVVIGVLCIFACVAPSFADQDLQTNFAVQLGPDKAPVELNAERLEIRDKDAIAIFSGNVSVVQGARALRTAKLVVHYVNDNQKTAGNAKRFASSHISEMQAFGDVYIKMEKQMATGEQAVFNGQTNIVTLTGSKVILSDGHSVATGCQLIVNLNTTEAHFESCRSEKKNNRVSVIIDPNENDEN